MKNLLKKKATNNAPKPAKKPLFSGLSTLGKKTAPTEPTTKPKKVKPTKKPLFAKKQSTQAVKKPTNLDPTKLLPVLLAVLGLVLAGLAYLFFFDAEEEVVQSEPATVVLPAEPTPETDVVTAEQITVIDNAEPVIQTVTIDPNAIDPASEPAPLSYDDFIRESETKIYREHDTTPPANTATAQ